MRIQVKKKHIKMGEPNQAKCCPVALAIKEKTKGRLQVFVGSSFIELGEPRNCRTHYVFFSKRTKKFIDEFDVSKKMKPFSFIMPLS